MSDTVRCHRCGAVVPVEEAVRVEDVIATTRVNLFSSVETRGMVDLCPRCAIGGAAARSVKKAADRIAILILLLCSPVILFFIGLLCLGIRLH